MLKELITGYYGGCFSPAKLKDVDVLLVGCDPQARCGLLPTAAAQGPMMIIDDGETDIAEVGNGR